MKLGTLFCDDAPAGLWAWIGDELGPDEQVVGLRKSATKDPTVDAAQWLLVTTARNALVAHDGARADWVDLPTEAAVTVEKSLTRVTWTVGGRSFDALRLTSSDLEDLVAIAFESRARMLLLAATAHAQEGEWAAADELLVACGEELDDDEVVSGEGFLMPRQEVLLRRSVARARLGDHDGAVTLLAELSQALPDDDLVEAGARLEPPSEWWLSLALAHEEAGDHASAAAVYDRLGTEADDVFLVQRARNLREAGLIDDALAAYDTFVAGRADDDFRLVAAQAEQAEELDETVDIGTATALLESAEMLESAGRLEDAVDRYVDAVRFAPYTAEPFRGLFAVAARLPAEARAERAFVLTQAAQIAEVILPRLAEELDEAGELPAPETARRWEAPFAPLGDDTHDSVVVHRGERATRSVAQKWTAALLKDERDTSDIVRHAQPADRGAFPVVDTILERVSTLLGTPVPRAFLSHGSSGIDVLGSDGSGKDPFILLGAAHLDPDSPLALTDAELAFALATQVEHIRAGHLLLTSSEFWKTFGTLSMTAVLAFVPMGDLLGKFTDGAVLKWFGKLKSAPSNAVTKMIELGEKRVKEGAGRSSVQSAYTATLGKLRQAGLASADKDDSHMVKERLADFARCAQYTADRVGLLVADDLSSSVAAMLRLSPGFGADAQEALDEGLAAVLSERGPKGELVHGELVLRLGELFKFAMSQDFRDLRDASTPSAA